MRRLVLVALCVLGATGPASAQDGKTKAAITLCGKPGTAVDVVIDTCTIAIDSQFLKTKELSTAHNNRGIAWSDKGNAERALADYNRALAIDPGNLRAQVNRGHLLLKQDKFDRALADYEAVIQRDRKFVQAYVGRAAVWMQKEDFRRAVADYETVLRLDPNNEKVKELLAGAKGLAELDNFADELDKEADGLEKEIGRLEKERVQSAKASEDARAVAAEPKASSRAPSASAPALEAIGGTLRPNTPEQAAAASAPIPTIRSDPAPGGSSAALPAEAPLPEPRPARTPEAATAKPAPTSAERDAQVRADYELTERVGSVQAWEAFLARYPTGFYAELARQQRAKLAARTPPAPREPAARPGPAAPKKSAPAAKSAQNAPKREQQVICGYGGCQPVPPNCHVTRGYLAGQQGALSHTDQLVCR
jgi:tetratricopeptide (TPR) repeat protein